MVRRFLHRLRMVKVYLHWEKAIFWLLLLFASSTTSSIHFWYLSFHLTLFQVLNVLFLSSGRDNQRINSLSHSSFLNHLIHFYTWCSYIRVLGIVYTEKHLKRMNPILETSNVAFKTDWRQMSKNVQCEWTLRNVLHKTEAQLPTAITITAPAKTIHVMIPTHPIT